MNCTETLELLSPLHDGELSADLRESVEAHLRECSSCAAALAEFGSMSSLVGGQTDPAPPADLWQQIETALDSDAETPSNPVTTVAAPGERRRQRLLLAVALALFAVAGVSLYMQLPGRSVHDPHLAVNFDEFLNEFPQSAERAQDLLHGKYPAELVDIEQASMAVKYRPAIANELPAGYTLDSIHLVRMPCCLCVESLCTAPDGARLTVLEHAIDQPIWFGERPSESCTCDGRQARLVRFDGRLAATWKAKQGYVTVIGIRDEDQLAEVMAHLDPSAT